MLSSEGTNMAIESYQSQAEHLLKNYVFADFFAVYTSVSVGIFACKTVYDLAGVLSAPYFKSYSNISRPKQVEWNNRAISTLHAIYITIVSLYFVLWSDLFTNDLLRGPITLRSSPVSIFALGISLGYFLSDFGMIIWFYPSLGGMEYVLHHLLSVVGVTYAMLTGEAQIYTFKVLLSEATTPSINLRWYLDAAGMKRSRVYIVNGVVVFVAWLVARILLFIYVIHHAYMHYDQVMRMHTFGVLLVHVVPAVLSVMNSIWFWKIFKGMKKTLAKRQ